MAGKPNTKWKESMLEKHGSEEALTEWLRTIGQKGGQKGTTGGFWADRELARTAGRIGGTKSKRTSK
jgi:general stress protein YciG